MKQQTFLTLALLMAGCGAIANAATLQIHFDELSTQSASGVSLQGVTFGFTVGGSASGNATFNADLPAAMTYLDSHVLMGPIGGVLSLDFLTPTTLLQFGFVLNTLDPQQPGAFVELFDASLQSLGSTPVDSDALVMFSEGQFSYSGTAISRALISFNTNAAADVFAIDNLQFEGDTGTTPGGSAVPEARTFLLTGSVLMVLGLLRAKRTTSRLVKPKRP